MAKKGKYVYDWPRPMVTADAVVFALFAGKVKLLLIKRKNQPFKGKWALPGGFVDMDEELQDAAVRELMEEAGIAGVRLEPMHTFGKCGRDPRGRVITVAFIGVASEGKRKTKAGDDAAEARWFDIEKLPMDLAFDHNEVAKFAIEKLNRMRRLNVKIKDEMGKKEISSISYCGLYCGDCFIRVGKIAELAKKLSNELKVPKFEKYAMGLSKVIKEFKPLSHYKEFYKALCSLDGLRCEKICRQGGGTTSCKIRECCTDKGIDGCWLCNKFEYCKKLAWLEPVNGDANLKNLRKIKKEGIQEFLKGKKYWS